MPADKQCAPQFPAGRLYSKQAGPMKERNIMQDFNKGTVPQYRGPGSQSELIDGVGYFLIVECPADINKRILHILAHNAAAHPARLTR